MDNREIELKLNAIFKHKSNDHFVAEIISRGYVCSLNQSNKILFVGINPSYTKNAVKESFLYKIEDAVKKYPKHYKKFSDLIAKTKYKNDWTYIDLFNFRETNQKQIDLIIKTDIDFLLKQLMLSFNKIKNINPEIIIVANSRASNFFGVNSFLDKNNQLTNIWYGLKFEFNKENGLMKVIGIDSGSILKVMF